jgi:hypothetical protein
MLMKGAFQIFASSISINPHLLKESIGIKLPDGRRV